ncbi:hypothetical protein LX92_02793 [Maribacter polysiphoniae]|uniref:Uncharacterized protein n=1 Tax=Maribacter polysiphoniae TaxID=429344 RepID=A0A316DY55_9FLAO|nr:hypothetical protein LX92_02793 [Maribacter polysiphoniae]
MLLFCLKPVTYTKIKATVDKPKIEIGVIAHISIRWQQYEKINIHITIWTLCL